MKEKIEPGLISRHFRLQWVIATAISMAIGAAETMVAINKIGSMGALTWAIALLGILPGVAQWLVLRRYISRAGWWILTTAGGLILTVGPGYLTYKLSIQLIERGGSKGIAFLVILVLIGVNILFFSSVTGELQWIVLRNQFPKSSWWVETSARGWTVGMGIGMVVAIILILFMSVMFIIDAFLGIFALYYIRDTIFAWLLALIGALIGVITGMITGAEMVRLLQESTSNGSEETSEPLTYI